MPNLEIPTGTPCFPELERFGLKSIENAIYIYFDGDIAISTEPKFSSEEIANPSHTIEVQYKEILELIDLLKKDGKPIIIKPGNSRGLIIDFMEKTRPKKGEVLLDGKPIGSKGFPISPTDRIVVAEKSPA